MDHLYVVHVAMQCSWSEPQFRRFEGGANITAPLKAPKVLGRSQSCFGSAPAHAAARKSDQIE
jgi:hypothetical protein